MELSSFGAGRGKLASLLRCPATKVRVDGRREGCWKNELAAILLLYSTNADILVLSTHSHGCVPSRAHLITTYPMCLIRSLSLSLPCWLGLCEASLEEFWPVFPVSSSHWVLVLVRSFVRSLARSFVGLLYVFLKLASLAVLTFG